MSRFTWFQPRNDRSTTQQRSNPRRRSAFPLALESLEDRTLLSVFTVLNPNDSGPGSLRDTIATAPSGSTIQFDPGLANQTIGLTSGELLLSKDLTISGLGANQLAVSGNFNSPVFEVSSGVTASISGLTIESGNASDGTGGGIDNGGTVSLASCTVTGNMGSGAFNAVGGVMTVTASTFSFNSADSGAGIQNNGTLTVIESTFALNTANVQGGAIFDGDSASLTMVNSTIGQNQGTGGGLFVSATASATLESTIVAKNTADGFTPDDVSGVVTSDGFNLIGHSGGSSGWVSSDILDPDHTLPLLGPLTDNGGPTQTMALMAGSPDPNDFIPASPEIDAGALSGLTPSTDQRGLPRVVNGTPDIGALEFQNLQAVIDIPSVNTTYNGQEQGTTAEVFDANTNQDLGPATLLTYDSFFTPVDVGTYTATGWFFGYDDYAFVKTSASIVINQATPTVTINSIDVPYDGQPHGTTAAAFGVDNVPLGIAPDPLLTIVYPNNTVPVTPGTYTVTAVYPGDNDYAPATATGTITIEKASLTVTVQPSTKVYGAANPAFTVSYQGFIGNDGPSSLSGQLSFTTSATTSSGVGQYVVSVSGLSSSSYNITFVTGTLSVTPAALTVTVNNASRVYGAANPAFTVSYQSFVNNDGPGSLSGQLSFTTSATASSGVGQYAVSASGLSSSNYTINFVAGTLTVTPAVLTVTANNASRVFGVANPVFTATITGFVNNDPSSVVSGTASLTTSATPSSTVGAYTITAAAGSLSAANYTFTFQNGVLTITKATPVITWSNPASITSNTPLSSTQLDATANVAGTFVYSPPAGTTLPVGTNTLTTTFTPTDTTDYNSATATVTIQVTSSGPGTGVSVSGTTLTIVGGDTSNDQIVISPIGRRNDGSTGVEVDAILNGVFISKQFRQQITTITVTEGNGNENILLACSLNVVVSITAGDGNDNVLAGSGAFDVTLGNGNDNVLLGDGDNVVTAGNGRDNVLLGNGDNVITLGNGCDNVLAGCGNNVVTVGNGNVNVLLGGGNNTVTLGDGNDNVIACDGNNVVTVGNGNVNICLGDGANTVTLGDGNDNVNVGDGNNVVVAGNGRSNVNAGNGNNFLVAGLGRNNVHAGNGRNILIDGNVTLTQSGDSLRKVLNDWVHYGSQSSNVASIRSRLSVTYNTTYANSLTAGSGLDWFWAVYAHDSLNKKHKDLLN